MKNVLFWYVTRVALVRTDVLLKSIASIVRVTRIGEQHAAVVSYRLLT
jgi:hypothetical protein